MKYEKARVAIIQMEEEDIIVTSGCTTDAYLTEDSCTGGNHKDKYSGCTNAGHQK